MAEIAVSLVIVGVVVGFSFVAAGQELPKSPEVQADRMVVFRLLAPNASRVQLTGFAWEQPVPLTRGSGGVWSVTVGPMAPGIYTYNFDVDGMTVSDPANPRVKFWQGMSSQVEVTGAAPLAFEAQEAPHGILHRHEYYSKTLMKTRPLVVYTPPGYEKGSRKYPALYLLHGWGDTEIVWTEIGRAHRIAENLQAAGKARPMLIVMPYGHADFPGAAAPPNNRPPTSVEALDADLFNEIVPFVESNYRVSKSAHNRAIAGLSMGGTQSLIIGLNHPEMFEYVMAFSSAIPRRTFDDDFPDLSENPQKETRNLKLLWVGCGKQDDSLPGNERFHEWLDGKKVEHTWHSSAGAHQWPVWREYLEIVLPLLFVD